MLLHKSLLTPLLRGIVALSVAVILCTGTLHTQTFSRQQPNLMITFNAQVIDADVVYLGDLAFNLQDLIIAQNGPIFFFMTILSDEPTYVMFGIDIVADTDVAPEGVELFSGLTYPVQLVTNQPHYYTSRDLAPGGPLELYEAETIQFNGGPAGAQKIIDAIRATSRLPDGTYAFYLTVYVLDENDASAPPFSTENEYTQIVDYLYITNPTSVDLLSPMDGDQLVTQFPLFQWRADTRNVRLFVYEMQPGMRSPEEAITGIPHLETDPLTINQFFYPQSGSGVRALEPGKQYVWFLRGMYRTSANREEYIMSELYTFSITDPGAEGQMGTLLDRLERLLGGEFGDGDIQFIKQVFHDNIEITLEEFEVLMTTIDAGVNNAVIQNVTTYDY